MIAITCVSKDSCQHGYPWQHPQWPICYDKACGCSLGWFSWIPQYQTCGRNLHMPSGLVLASVAKDYPTKRTCLCYLVKKNQTLWPKQSSGLALVLSPPPSPPPCIPYTGKLVTLEIRNKEANSHDLFKSLYTQNVTFGIAQICIVKNAMYVFLLRCSSCSAAPSWLRWIFPGAQGPGSPYRDALLVGLPLMPLQTSSSYCSAPVPLQALAKSPLFTI